MTWKRSEKPQPAGAKFMVPSTDAPNVNGARDSALRSGRGTTARRTPLRLRTAVERGRVKALYVVDPGPGRLDSATSRGSSPPAGAARCRCSIVQGVVMSELAAAADIVLAGCGMGREGRDLHERPGHGAGRVASHRAARRGHGGLADPCNAGSLAGSDAARTSQPSDVRCAIAAAMPGRRTPTPTRWRSRDRFRPATGCRHRIPPSAGSGTSCTRTCRR